MLRWSIQRANGKYKDHLFGQLTSDSHQKGNVINKFTFQLWNVWLHYDMISNWKYDLKVHIRNKHESLNSVSKVSCKCFQCETCDFISNWKYDLKVHIRNKQESLNSVSKVFCKCFQCGDFTSKREFNLELHIRTRHESSNLVYKVSCKYFI